MYPGTWAATRPDATAVVVPGTGEQLTYAQLDQASNRLAHWLRSIGCGIGDHIALLMGNTAALFPVAWAAQRAGLYYTPVNWHLTPEEMAFVVGDCGAKVLVVDAEHAGLAAELAEHTPTLRVAVHGADVAGCLRLEAVVQPMPDHPVADETEGSDMIYTSGTTGRPKGGGNGSPGSTRPTITPSWSPWPSGSASARTPST